MKNENIRKLSRLIVVLLIANLITISVVTILYLKPGESATTSCSDFPPNKKLEELLDFTPEQRKTFNEMKQQHRSGSVFIHKEIGEIRKSLLSEIVSPNPDTIKIFTLNAELADLHEKQQNRLSLHLISVRSICTGNQIKKYDSTITKIIMTHPDCRMKDGKSNHRGRHGHKHSDCSTKN
jgi:hypothetical protein